MLAALPVRTEAVHQRDGLHLPRDLRSAVYTPTASCLPRSPPKPLISSRRRATELSTEVRVAPTRIDYARNFKGKAAGYLKSFSLFNGLLRLQRKRALWALNGFQLPLR